MWSNAPARQLRARPSAVTSVGSAPVHAARLPELRYMAAATQLADRIHSPTGGVSNSVWDATSSLTTPEHAIYLLLTGLGGGNDTVSSRTNPLPSARPSPRRRVERRHGGGVPPSHGSARRGARASGVDAGGSRASGTSRVRQRAVLHGSRP